MARKSTKVREVRYDHESGDYVVVTLFVENIFAGMKAYAEGDTVWEWGVVARGTIYSTTYGDEQKVKRSLPYGFEKYEDALDCATNDNLSWSQFG